MRGLPRWHRRRRKVPSAGSEPLRDELNYLFDFTWLSAPGPQACSVSSQSVNPSAGVHLLSDPNGIVELDQYLLVVVPNRQSMGGLTGEHGAWTGQFYHSR